MQKPTTPTGPSLAGGSAAAASSIATASGTMLVG